MRSWVNNAVGYSVEPCCEHKWLLLGCFIATMAYAMMSVKGESSPSSYGHGFVFFEHGWPMVYMERMQPDAAWASRWRVCSGIYRSDYAPLLFNIAVAIGLSLLITHLWHLHCAHAGPWQFTLREFLLVTFVLCAALGAYAKLRGDYVRQKTYLSGLEEMGWSPRCAGVHMPWYFQPLKDLGIICPFDDWIYMGVEWDYVSDPNVGTRDINHVLVDLVSQGRRLSFLREIVIADPRLTDKGVELLCKWAPRCTNLHIFECPKVTDKGVAYVASHLTSLTHLGVEGARITDDAIRRIATLRGLETLTIDEQWNSTTAGSMKALCNLPRLTGLRIPRHWNVDEEDKAWLLRRNVAVWYGRENRVAPVLEPMGRSPKALR